MPRKKDPLASKGTDGPAWRDPKTGRFVKGHPGGLRLGRRNRNRTMEARIQAAARELMIRDLERTSEQVIAAARAGDLRASTYMLDRYLPKEDDIKPMMAQVDLTSIEGVNDAVRQLVTGVLTGDNQAGDVKTVMDLLQRLVGMEAQQQLKNLEQLAEVASKGGEQGQLEMDPELLPVWGRLVDGE